jgi:hypothetical protein
MRQCHSLPVAVSEGLANNNCSVAHILLVKGHYDMMRIQKGKNGIITHFLL